MNIRTLLEHLKIPKANLSRLADDVKKLEQLKREAEAQRIYSESAIENINAFTDKEVEAAKKRYLKVNVNIPLLPLSGVKVEHEVEIVDLSSKFIGRSESASFWLRFIKAMFGIAFPPPIHYRGAEADWLENVEIHHLLREFDYEVRKEIISELRLRKAISILKNTLSSTFKFRDIISAQTHLREVIYKYFDIVFSLKEIVVVRIYSIQELFTQQFFTNEKETKFRYIPIIS